MNEKIRKLGVEAGLIVEEWDGFNRRQLDPAQQRFAELIIRECVSICNQAVAQNIETVKEFKEDERVLKLIMSGAIKQAEKISIGIKQHFKVEE